MLCLSAGTGPAHSTQLQQFCIHQWDEGDSITYTRTAQWPDVLLPFNHVSASVFQFLNPECVLMTLLTIISDCNSKVVIHIPVTGWSLWIIQLTPLRWHPQFILQLSNPLYSNVHLSVT